MIQCCLKAISSYSQSENPNLPLNIARHWHVLWPKTGFQLS